MKNQELIVLGLAGAAVYMIWKSQKPRVNAPTDTGKRTDWVGQIFNSEGAGFSNGWQYFDNGTAIDPRGNYYFDGQMVYQAAGAGA